MSVNFDTKNFYKIIGENIRKYRKIRNYSLQVLAEKLELTKKTVQRYEMGEHKIEGDRLTQIAKALDVKVEQLTEGVHQYLGAEDDSENVSLPIYGRISCGSGTLVGEEVEGYEVTPRSWLNGGEYFYLRAKGDSMTGARIFDGDLLLIRKQEDVEDGEIAAVMIDDEAVLKRVYKNNDMIILQSENPSYAPIVVTEETPVKIIGKLNKIVINL